MIRFGVIGCGNISRFHFEGIKQVGAAVTCICDVNEAVGKAKAEEWGAEFTTDYKKLVSSKIVDAVLVLTSGKYYRDICELAISEGKHIIYIRCCMNNATGSMRNRRSIRKHCYFRKFYELFILKHNIACIHSFHLPNFHCVLIRQAR